MTNLGNVAAQALELYNNGRTTSSDNKLEYEDFLQFVFGFYGDVSSIQYYKELKAGNHDFYFSQSIKTVTCELKTEKRHIPHVELEDYALLPYMNGILAIYPFSDDGYRDPEDDFVKMKPAGVALFCKPKALADTGEKYWVPKGLNIELYGCDKSLKKIYIEYIPMSEDDPVTDQIGIVILQQVIKLVWPGKINPVDNTEDTNPNVTTVKQKLDQPQTIN